MTATPPPDPWPAWHAAAADPRVDAALRDLYARLDAAVAARGPTCWVSGNCCKFEAYGHRLYVTALETAWVLANLPPGVPRPYAPPTPPVAPASPANPKIRRALRPFIGANPGPGISSASMGYPAPPGEPGYVGGPAAGGTAPAPPQAEGPLLPACVFQVDGLCTVHAIRPLGCRIFFCQKGTEEWQHELYETFLGELRSLHDRLALPYCYMEWRLSLREAQATRPSR